MNEIWGTEAIGFLFALLLAGVTGVSTYLWSRRRSRERDLFLLWRNAFDRAAFRGSYDVHSSKDQYRSAIAATLKAIAVGRLLDSHGQELSRVDGVYRGPSQIRNEERRKAILDVRDRLQKIRRLSFAEVPAKQMDDERDAVIKKMNEVWEDLSIEPMPLPSKFTEPEDIEAILGDLEEERIAAN